MREIMFTLYTFTKYYMYLYYCFEPRGCHILLVHNAMIEIQCEQSNINEKI